MRINTNSPEEAAEVIYDTLLSIKFEQWYTKGTFTNHISGDHNCPTKDRIINDIKRLFKINQ